MAVKGRHKSKCLVGWSSSQLLPEYPHMHTKALRTFRAIRYNKLCIMTNHDTTSPHDTSCSTVGGGWPCSRTPTSQPLPMPYRLHNCQSTHAIMQHAQLNRCGCVFAYIDNPKHQVWHQATTKWRQDQQQLTSKPSAMQGITLPPGGLQATTTAVLDPQMACLIGTQACASPATTCLC